MWADTALYSRPPLLASLTSWRQLWLAAEFWGSFLKGDRLMFRPNGEQFEHKCERRTLDLTGKWRFLSTMFLNINQHTEKLSFSSKNWGSTQKLPKKTQLQQEPNPRESLPVLGELFKGEKGSWWNHDLVITPKGSSVLRTQKSFWGLGWGTSLAEKLALRTVLF